MEHLEEAKLLQAPSGHCSMSSMQHLPEAPWQCWKQLSPAEKRTLLGEENASEESASTATLSLVPQLIPSYLPVPPPGIEPCHHQTLLNYGDLLTNSL